MGAEGGMEGGAASGAQPPQNQRPVAAAIIAAVTDPSRTPRPDVRARPRVILLRGHMVNHWDLRPWERLGDRFDVSCLVTGDNEFDTRGLAIPLQQVRARRDKLPSGRLGRALAYA